MLYAENELFAAELAAVRTYAERYAQIVNVYKAMGGGWVDLADARTPAGQATPLPRSPPRSDRQTPVRARPEGLTRPSGAGTKSRGGPFRLSGSPPSAGAPGSGMPLREPNSVRVDPGELRAEQEDLRRVVDPEQHHDQRAAAPKPDEMPLRPM